MNFKARDIAQLLNGVVEGNPDVTVNNVSKIEEGEPGTLSFLANPKYNHYIYKTKSSVVLVGKDFKPEKTISATLIRVEDAYQAIATLLEMYEQNKPHRTGIEQPAFVSKTAQLGENVYVGAFAYVSSNAKIGDDVKIYPHVFIGDNVEVKSGTVLNSGVKIYENCRIGANCILHSGVVVGSDGFGFASQADQNYKKVPQIGNVVIEDAVEIGANTCIDRATMGSTIIRKGVKLDNLIQIAHNVEIDQNTVIAAQSGIAGSTKIGKNCKFGGQSGIIGHLKIADEVKIAAQSGISSHVKQKGLIVQGSPAFDFALYQKSYVVFKNLPKLRQQLIDLEKDIQKLKAKY